MIIKLDPLTAEAFAPYGEVLTIPVSPGRSYFDGALANHRPEAHASLSIARREDVATLPFTATMMERHEFSSQSFVPLDVGRWLIMVAPHAPGGGPDMTRAKAFLPAPGQGVTFGANVWHHPMTILDKPATFAVVMWLTRGAGDEEFFTLPTPVQITP
jgi:ureidoglycolate lyase